MDHRYVSYVLRVYVPGTWCLPWCIVFFVFWFVCFGCMLLFYCLNLPVPGIYRFCFFFVAVYVGGGGRARGAGYHAPRRSCGGDRPGGGSGERGRESERTGRNATLVHGRPTFLGRIDVFLSMIKCKVLTLPLYVTAQALYSSVYEKKKKSMA